MKGLVTILGAVSVGIFTYDFAWGVIRERFHWTTIAQVFRAAGFDRQFPEFVQGAATLPILLAFLVPAVVFYLLIVWLDYN
jgi:hypothetical protein